MRHKTGFRKKKRSNLVQVRLQDFERLQEESRMFQQIASRARGIVNVGYLTNEDVVRIITADLPWEMP